MNKHNKGRRSSRNGTRPKSTSEVSTQNIPARAAGEPILAQRISMSRSHSGPLPDAQTFAEYNAVVPGTAERIIDQFVKQSNHRMALEQAAVQHDIILSYLGLACGTLVAVVCLVGSFYVVSIGKDVAGIAGIAASIGGLVGVFVYGTRSRRSEREAKMDAMSGHQDK